MHEYEYITATKTDPPKRELTPRQRVCVYLFASLANDLDIHSSRAEKHTAALLRLVNDAVERGYEGELVALARPWRREVEAGEATV